MLDTIPRMCDKNHRLVWIRGYLMPVDWSFEETNPGFAFYLALCYSAIVYPVDWICDNAALWGKSNVKRWSVFCHGLWIQDSKKSGGRSTYAIYNHKRVHRDERCCWNQNRKESSPWYGCGVSAMRVYVPYRPTYIAPLSCTKSDKVCTNRSTWNLSFACNHLYRRYLQIICAVTQHLLLKIHGHWESLTSQYWPNLGASDEVLLKAREITKNIVR